MLEYTRISTLASHFTVLLSSKKLKKIIFSISNSDEMLTSLVAHKVMLCHAVFEVVKLIVKSHARRTVILPAFLSARSTT